jgi:entry exclusion lipoprotein TrbK
MMRNFLPLFALVAVLVAGCESSKDVNATVDTTAKIEKVSDDPTKQALLPKMTDAARKQLPWSSAADADKQLFLQYHDNDEAKAEKHYSQLVQMIKDGDI